MPSLSGIETARMLKSIRPAVAVFLSWTRCWGSTPPGPQSTAWPSPPALTCPSGPYWTPPPWRWSSPTCWKTPCGPAWTRRRGGPAPSAFSPGTRPSSFFYRSKTPATAPWSSIPPPAFPRPCGTGTATAPAALPPLPAKTAVPCAMSGGTGVPAPNAH